jgi:hypothetical protein
MMARHSNFRYVQYDGSYLFLFKFSPSFYPPVLLPAAGFGMVSF